MAALEAEGVVDRCMHSRCKDHGLAAAVEDQGQQMVVGDTRSFEDRRTVRRYALAVGVEVEDAVRSLGIHRDHWQPAAAGAAVLELAAAAAAAGSAELKAVQAHPKACVVVGSGQTVAAQAGLMSSNLAEVEIAVAVTARQLNALLVVEMA